MHHNTMDARTQLAANIGAYRKNATFGLLAIMPGQKRDPLWVSGVYLQNSSLIGRYIVFILISTLVLLDPAYDDECFTGIWSAE